MQDTEITEQTGYEEWLRPQSVIFTLLAEHLLDRDLPAVFAGSIIAVLERVGITEHATRATLARMERRGLLDKQRSGRRSYFQMTSRCVSILEGGRERIWLTGAVNRQSVERWTLVTFSLPERWQRKRYDLRVRLSWAGFAPLQNGVWVAPSAPDVEPILRELELHDHVRVFRADSVHPDDPRTLVSEAFELDAIAERYRQFLETWRPLLDAAPVEDALALTMRRSTHGLRALRDDPRVPLHLLPGDWPAVEAQDLFRQLHERHREAARTQADALLELAT